MPVEIQTVRIQPAGFRLQFTVAMNREGQQRPETIGSTASAIFTVKNTARAASTRVPIEGNSPRR
jgi:hypothetical protein